MAEIVKVEESETVVTKSTVKLTVVFEYEKVNGEFTTAEDKAHYEKYAEFKTQTES